MTDWRSLRGSNFLSPDDLADGPALCTIVEVKGETMLDDDEKPKKEVFVVIAGKVLNRATGQIRDLEKTEWVANVVNLTLMEHLFGTPHIEQWAGMRMLLQQEPCEVPGKFKDQPCVRVGGSPDIPTDIPVEIVLKMKGGKKRKPIHRVLKSTRKAAAPAPEPPTEPVAEPVAEPARAATFDADAVPGVGSEDGDAAIARQIETMANEPRITRGMLTRLGALGSQLTDAGIPEDQWRAEIFTLTSGRTTSRTDLTEVEAKVLSVNLSALLEDARAAKVGAA